MHLFARGGYPVLGTAAAVAALLIIMTFLSGGTLQALFRWLAGLGVFFLLFSLYFFRDPDRSAPADPHVLHAPADGTIIDIGEMDEPVYMKTKARRVCIFMSVFNVHVNRSPMDGTIEYLHHNPGKFISAFKEKASEENESIFAGLASADGSVRVSVKFIAGLIARRIAFYKKAGDTVKQGERINLIRFGSRVDIYCPADAEIKVKNGDKVTAGMTVIAALRK